MNVRLALRPRRAVGLALTACSLAVVFPATASATYDLRSPDARDAALAAAQPLAPTDLRSPDARDAALVAAQPSARTDLRSPDARDAALAAAAGTQSAPPSSVVVEPTVVPVVEHGSQTLAIVFSSTALFIALLAIGFAAIYRRPRPRWSAS
jgi:hypothetical protein